MITEDQLEQQCLGWFHEGGWKTVFGPDIAHDRCAWFTLPQTLANLRRSMSPMLLREQLPVATAMTNIGTCS